MAQQKAPAKGLIAKMTETVEAGSGGGSFGAPLGGFGASFASARVRRPLVVMYHLDTNQGDATIIIGSALSAFIDCSFAEVGTRMCNIAAKLGIDRVDVLSISHFDKDHFYGTRNVLTYMRPRVVLTPARAADLQAASHLGACRQVKALTVPDSDLVMTCQQLFDRNGSGGTLSCNGRGKTLCTASDNDEHAPFTVRVPSDHNGGVLDFGGGVRMEVLCNGGGKALETVRDDNDTSVAWLMQAAGVRYYTAGDLEGSEEALVRGPLKNVQLHVVKCGHHGSDASTSAAFLKSARPKVGILQGSAAMYPHPTAAVLERLASAKVETFATGFYVGYGPRPTVCGGDRFAGDAVVTIWDDGVFSVYWVDDGGGPHCCAWAASDGSPVKLGKPEQDALLAHIPLSKLADLSVDFNGPLAKSKAKHALLAKSGGGKKKKKEKAPESDGMDVVVHCEECGAQMENEFNCEVCGVIVCHDCRPEDSKMCPTCAAE